MNYRAEKDVLGEKNISENVYWGIHTQRALENFRLSGCKVNPALLKSLAMVKKAAAETNLELKFLEASKAKSILMVCDEIISGKLLDQFPLDALQGGAGTSTNMNINEVIANRALELSGAKKGEYHLFNPIEDVNLHQSTNDVYPTALKIAIILNLRNLSQEIARLQGAFQQKEKEFVQIVKIGRTELQEAVPITLGAEFGVFAEAFGRDRWRTFKSEERLRVVNIGGTAVGTGMGAPRSYIFLVIEKLREITGLGLARGENVMDATANCDCFVEVSGILKAHASNLIKTSNDLRLMNLLGEIKLPKMQAGSSIMPGKVNPVILESAIQIAMKVIANDQLITETCSKSSLQINEFMPLLAHAFLESLDLLISINSTLANHIQAIQADTIKCQEYFDRSPMIVTALLPYIGYDKAQKLLQEFQNCKGHNLREFLSEKLGQELIEKVFSPHNLVVLGYRDGKST